MIFDEHYFKSVNYTDYLERSNRYDQLAHEVMTHLKVHDLDKDPILDFGCAVGFLIEGLQKLGYKDVYGSDVSDWALEEARKKNLDVEKEPRLDVTHGVTFALDVLEHMPENEMRTFLDKLKTKVLVFRIPIRREEDDDYFLECSRADPTHVICWTKEQWRDLFSYKGYIALDLNLHTIYNSTGVYSGIALSKEI